MQNRAYILIREDRLPPLSHFHIRTPLSRAFLEILLSDWLDRQTHIQTFSVWKTLSFRKGDMHNSFYTENEIYLPQQSLAIIYSKSYQQLYIRKCEKPRNERYTNKCTMKRRKYEMINYFITRRQVNVMVDLHRKQDDVQALFDCFVRENQNRNLEDFKQPKIGIATE